MSRTLEDILSHCGYDSALTFIRDNSTQDELLDLLEALLHECKSTTLEVCEEIASDRYNWVDYEALQDAADEARYQEYRDRRNE